MIHGIVKVWATRFGLTVEEYLEKRNAKLKRCQKCHEWKHFSEYPKDSSRYDGMFVKCFTCNRINRPPKWHILTESEKNRLRKRNKKNKWRKGIPLSNEHKQLLRNKRIEEGKNGKGSFYGSNNPNWKNGISTENQILRNNSDYHQWRTKIFERDNYTCQGCGDKKGGNLNSHHVKPWAEHKELRYDINNGITLCSVCHYKIHDKPDSYRKRRKQKRLLKKS